MEIYRFNDEREILASLVKISVPEIALAFACTASTDTKIDNLRMVSYEDVQAVCDDTFYDRHSSQATT